MLRRHLRSGAAPVAACAGFDLDAASAYLEGALGLSHRASYESHLAGCAICRRHLIELARLTQAAPLFEARPTAAPDRIPAWDRWKEAVARWFHLPAWNLKWQIAGATGAAFAILIAALGVQLWRRAPNQPADLAVSRANASPPASELTAEAFPSPTPELPSQDAVTRAEGFIAIPQRPSQDPVPAPLIGPTRNTQDVVAALASRDSDSLMLSSSQPAEAPPAAKPSGGEVKQSPPPQPRAFTQKEFSRAGGSVLEVGEASEERAGDEIARGANITLPPY